MNSNPSLLSFNFCGKKGKPQTINNGNENEISICRPVSEREKGMKPFPHNFTAPKNIFQSGNNETSQSAVYPIFNFKLLPQQPDMKLNSLFPSTTDITGTVHFFPEKQYSLVEVNYEDITIEPQLITQDFKFAYEEFICSICLTIAINPRECKNCSTIFCDKCIKKWKNKNRTCPSKCSGFIESELNRILKNILNKILVTCPLGCDQIIPYEKLFSHYPICNNAEYRCNGCKTISNKLGIEEHATTCMELPITCELCNRQCLKKDIKLHMEAFCEGQIIQCNECKMKMKRREQLIHKREDCVSKVIQYYEEQLCLLKKENDELKAKLGAYEIKEGIDSNIISKPSI